MPWTVINVEPSLNFEELFIQIKSGTVTQTVFILFVVSVLQKRECIKEYQIESDFISA